MEDPRVTGGVGCDDRCGCLVPCPGGSACRCAAKAITGGGGMEEFTHKRCSCGMHCSCNPFKCGDGAGFATLGSRCTCGSGYSCATCMSGRP